MHQNLDQRSFSKSAFSSILSPYSISFCWVTSYLISSIMASIKFYEPAKKRSRWKKKHLFQRSVRTFDGPRNQNCALNFDSSWHSNSCFSVTLASYCFTKVSFDNFLPKKVFWFKKNNPFCSSVNFFNQKKCRKVLIRTYLIFRLTFPQNCKTELFLRNLNR